MRLICLRIAIFGVVGAKQKSISLLRICQLTPQQQQHGIDVATETAVAFERVMSEGSMERVQLLATLHDLIRNLTQDEY